jgi:hypothetical protein
MERKKKRQCKLNNKHWAKIAETAKVSDKLVTDLGGADDIPIAADDIIIASNDIPVVLDASESDSEESKNISEYSGKDKEASNARPLRRSKRNKKSPKTMSLLVTALELMAKSAHVFENVAALDTLVSIASLPTNCVKLEQDFGSAFLKEPEMKKLRELQILDIISGEDDEYIEWDIVEVIKHQTARVAQQIPKQYSVALMVTYKHVCLYVRFRNGEVQWTQMDAVKLQDPFPIIQYVKRNRLEKVPSFAWIGKIIQDNDRLVQLARAFKAKV